MQPTAVCPDHLILMFLYHTVLFHPALYNVLIFIPCDHILGDSYREYRCGIYLIDFQVPGVNRTIPSLIKYVNFDP